MMLHAGAVHSLRVILFGWLQKKTLFFIFCLLKSLERLLY